MARRDDVPVITFPLERYSHNGDGLKWYLTDDPLPESMQFRLHVLASGKPVIRDRKDIPDLGNEFYVEWYGDVEHMGYVYSLVRFLTQRPDTNGHENGKKNGDKHPVQHAQAGMTVHKFRHEPESSDPVLASYPEGDIPEGYPEYPIPMDSTENFSGPGVSAFYHCLARENRSK